MIHEKTMKKKKIQKNNDHYPTAIFY